MLVGRTLGLQLLTGGVTIVLARLLTPADYGLFAIALAVQLVGVRAAELGLPAALVRMEEEPSARLQSAVAGVLLVSSALLAAVLLIAAFALAPGIAESSRTLEVIAVAGCAIPFYAMRAIPMVLMERQLRFGRVAIVETADTLAFNGFALAAAFAGLGAFSLAAAVPAGGLAGMVAAWAVQSFARRPSLELDPVRPLIRFGLGVSLLQGVYLLKDLGFIVLLSAVGGVATAGFYAMAKRLFSFPIAVASAVSRVSFPALSRDPALRPGRAARIGTLTALVAGLPLALVAGAAEPLIDLLLGEEWLPATDIVVIGSLGMMILASAHPTMVSFALAEGRTDGPIAAAVVETTLLCLIVAVLVGPLGEAAVGIALALASIGAVAVLAIGTHPEIRRSLWTIAKSTLIAAVAVLAGQLLGVTNDIGGLAAALLVVAATWCALEAVFARRELRELIGLARPLIKRARTA